MSYFARVDKNNIVQSVHVVSNENLLNETGIEEEEFGIAYLNKLHGFGFTWVQTSKSDSFRKQYAGIGYTYDKTNDVFIEPKPFPSWTLDGSYEWDAPEPYPEDGTVNIDDGKRYDWNEDSLAWVETP